MAENAQTIEAQAVDHVKLTTEIVSAYVSNNSVRPADMAELIASTHAALSGLGSSAAPAAPAIDKPTPSQIRKSVTPDALISFIDGKPYKTLKRHLGSAGLTIETYRGRFGLPSNYPSTAANYSAQRSALAKSLGLGQQRSMAAPKAEELADAASGEPKRAGRPRKAKDATQAQWRGRRRIFPLPIPLPSISRRLSALTLPLASAPVAVFAPVHVRPARPNSRTSATVSCACAWCSCRAGRRGCRKQWVTAKRARNPNRDYLVELNWYNGDAYIINI